MTDVPTPPPRPARSWLVAALIVAALAANLAALALPLVDIDAVFKRKVVGLANSASLLWSHHLHVLAALALLLSVVFPLVKLAVLGWVWWGRGATRAQRRALRLVEALGKWSLFDVFLMALLIGLTRDQLVVAVTPCAGLAAFIGSVLAAMVAGERLTCGLSAHTPVQAPYPVPRSFAVTAALVALAALPAGAAPLLPVLGLHDWRLLPAELDITGIIAAAWSARAYALAGCCVLALVVFPLLSLRLDALAAVGADRHRPWLARWAMLDVLAVAVVVFALEGGSYVTATMRSGSAVLAAAIVGRWLLAWWVRERRPDPPR